MSRLIRTMSCVVALLLLGGHGLSKDKELPVIQGWGVVTNPDGACTLTAQKGKLTITIPDTLHDLNPRNGKLNAPRVLQDVDGDFVVEVKLTSDFEPGKMSTAPKSLPFIGAGLLIWADDKNYLRLERNLWWRADLGKHVCYAPLVEYFKEGVYQNTNPGTTDEPFFKGNSTWLRLERKGDEVKTHLSHDGKDWALVKAIPVALPRKVNVGILAINTSNRPFAVEFSEFRFVRMKAEKE